MEWVARKKKKNENEKKVCKNTTLILRVWVSGQQQQ